VCSWSVPPHSSPPRSQRGGSGSRAIPTVTCLVLVLQFLSCSAPPNRQHESPPFPQLVLEEIKAFPIDQHDNIRGALFLEGKILYWTPSQVLFLESDGTRHPVRCGVSRIAILGAGLVGYRVLVHDTITNTILQIDSTEQCVRRQRVPLRNLLASAPTDSGWVFLPKPGRGIPHLYSWSRTGEEPERVDLPPSLSDSTESEWLFLRSAGRHLFLGNHRHIGSWYMINSYGQRILTAGGESDEPAPAFLQDFLAETNPLWHGLAPIELDSGFLRVLADMKSDRRILQLYDQSGRLVRTTAIAAPVGFISSDLANSTALALRHAERMELVVYRWFWQ
jgi:hypothetical protein